jgi:hypothetical protein
MRVNHEFSGYVNRNRFFVTLLGLKIRGTRGKRVRGSGRMRGQVAGLSLSG